MESTIKPFALYYNKDASTWSLISNGIKEIERDVFNFHETLYGYKPTPLIELPNSHEFGVRKVFEEESFRFGLPSFKILGVLWAIYKMLVSEFNLPRNSSFITLKHHIRVALLLGVKFEAPFNVLPSECEKIRSEGNTNLTEIGGNYDDAVDRAYKFSLQNKNRYFIQDTSFANYTTIPKSTVEGYNTLLNEIDLDVAKLTGTNPSLVVCGAGVGSSAQAVVAHYRADFRKNPETKVLIIEPILSRCCNNSLISGIPSKGDELQTTPTIMDGLNCPTISELAFPILKLGLSY